jgi:hypothetical protein
MTVVIGAAALVDTGTPTEWTDAYGVPAVSCLAFPVNGPNVNLTDQGTIGVDGYETPGVGHIAINIQGTSSTPLNQNGEQPGDPIWSLWQNNVQVGEGSFTATQDESYVFTGTANVDLTMDDPLNGTAYQVRIGYDADGDGHWDGDAPVAVMNAIVNNG